jgi:hypothetical protein
VIARRHLLVLLALLLPLMVMRGVLRAGCVTVSDRFPRTPPVDAGGGRVSASIGWSDCSLGPKAIEWGVKRHTVRPRGPQLLPAGPPV